MKLDRTTTAERKADAERANKQAARDRLRETITGRANVVPVDPKFAPLPVWVALSGMTRTGTYVALSKGELRAIKQPGGRRTLIDVEHGLAWLRSQPAITIRAPSIAA
jgi:hypothetical protein